MGGSYAIYKIIKSNQHLSLHGTIVAAQSVTPPLPVYAPIVIKFTCDNKAGLPISLEPSLALPQCNNEIPHTKYMKSGDQPWTYISTAMGCVYSVVGAANICHKVAPGTAVNIYGKHGLCKCTVE